MKKREKILIALCVLLATALVVGLTTLAATSYGTQSDPLVTLSYLNDTVKPAIESALDSKISSASSSLTSSFDTKTAEYESKLASIAGGGSGGSGFSVISLSAGQTVTCQVGTEIMLRIGSVSSAGPDAPRLIDETGGGEVAYAGTALVKNHMYMVTIAGNGVTAASSAKVLIRGTYTVG